MKNMRKLALLMVSVLMVSVFAGCGNSFDASAYVKAILDNSYKNDSTGLVEQKVGTAEEAADIYEQGIDAEMQSITSQVSLSDELQAEYREVLQTMFKNCKYTVGEAEKQDDGSYKVTIKYQQMIVFAPTVDAFNEQSAAYIDDMTNKALNGEETPSEDQINEEVFTMLKDCLKTAVENATFAEEAEATVRVELVNNVWTPNETDLSNLELLLLDADAASNL